MTLAFKSCFKKRRLCCALRKEFLKYLRQVPHLHEAHKVPHTEPTVSRYHFPSYLPTFIQIPVRLSSCSKVLLFFRCDSHPYHPAVQVIRSPITCKTRIGSNNKSNLMHIRIASVSSHSELIRPLRIRSLRFIPTSGIHPMLLGCTHHYQP